MSKVLQYLFLTLLVGNIFCYRALWMNARIARGISVHFLSVGQGDAEFIQTPAGNILIDGGPSDRTLFEMDKFLNYPDRTVDVVMMSHPNLDHLASFISLLKRYNVRLFVMTGVKYDSLTEYQEIIRLLRDKHTPTLYAVAGQRITFGGPALDVLWPQVVLRSQYYPVKDLNDTSIVARFSYQNFRALFTGDLTSVVEKQLIPIVGRLTVLKVAHHGSRFASDSDFLAATKPEIAVIEVGKNRYGHPTKEALSRLAAAGAKIFRTDLDGTVTLSIQDSKFTISASGSKSKN